MHPDVLLHIQQKAYRDYATDWTTGVQFPAGDGDFSVRHRVQTGSGTHPASYPTGTGTFIQEIKRSGREVGHLSPSSAEVKECVEL
jgi:hypothetical protein